VGVYQVNAVIPEGVSSGKYVPVTIGVAGARSQAGATIAVK
jgi:uncharacterized protein (TIGR03437 family)